MELKKVRIMTKKASVKKVVLSYSGGLETSVIVPWLRNNYNCEVVCFTADLGQEEELSGLDEKAKRFARRYWQMGLCVCQRRP